MLTSPLNELHERRGAHMGARPEATSFSTPLSFGDVQAEYRAARSAAALFDATQRGRLAIGGSDARDFLHRILANEVRPLANLRGNRNLLLSPKGKVLFELDLEPRAELFLCSTPPGCAELLRAGLERYLFAENVRMEDESARHAPLELCGPAARSLLESLLRAELDLETRETRLLPFPGASRRSEEGREPEPVAVTALLVAGVPGYRVDGGPERARELWRALTEAGARPAGLLARDVLRIENGAPLFGVDVDDEVYPQEAALEDAISLSKGCYVGQEVVAKIDTYGGPNQRLVGLAIDHSRPLPPGTRLLAEGGGRGSGEEREAGRITSWTRSFALESGLALGYVKRRHLEEGSAFRLSAARSEPSEDVGGSARRIELPLR